MGEHKACRPCSACNSILNYFTLGIFSSTKQNHSSPNYLKKLYFIFQFAQRKCWKAV